MVNNYYLYFIKNEIFYFKIVFEKTLLKNKLEKYLLKKKLFKNFPEKKLKDYFFFKFFCSLKKKIDILEKINKKNLIKKIIL